MHQPVSQSMDSFHGEMWAGQILWDLDLSMKGEFGSVSDLLRRIAKKQASLPKFTPELHKRAIFCLYLYLYTDEVYENAADEAQ